jgi:hypothetical protein
MTIKEIKDFIEENPLTASIGYDIVTQNFKIESFIDFKVKEEQFKKNHPRAYSFKKIFLTESKESEVGLSIFLCVNPIFPDGYIIRENNISLMNEIDEVGIEEINLFYWKRALEKFKSSESRKVYGELKEELSRVLPGYPHIKEAPEEILRDLLTF